MKPGYEEDDEYIRELLERFETLLEEGGYVFFDTGELEDIIFHYFNESDFQKARKAIDFAISRYPADVTFEVFKAQYLLNTGQPEKALLLLDILRKKDPSNPDIMLTRATVLSNLDRHEDAIREFLKALGKIDEDKNEVYQNIAFEYENLGQYETAVEYLIKALQYDPQNESILYEIGYCYDLGGLSEKAAAFFIQYLDVHPYSYVAWYNLGLAYSILELYEKAIDAFDFSIAVEPKFSPAHYSKAQAYEQMEMFQQAIQVYKHTMEFEKADAMVHYYLGDCYEKLGKFETALDHYRKAVGLERQFADAWMGIGICLNELGNFPEAVSNMRQAVKLEPENAEFWYILADALLDDGLPDDAEKAYEKVTQLDPMHQEIWLDYSEFYANIRHDYNRALEIIEEGAYHQPLNSSVSYRIVAYLLESGKEKEAIRELYIAMSQDYDNHKSLLEYSESARLSSAVNEAIASFSQFSDLT
jgi:tetratricopeptide (TPR) repeat protein